MQKKSKEISDPSVNVFVFETMIGYTYKHIQTFTMQRVYFFLSAFWCRDFW